MLPSEQNTNESRHSGVQYVIDECVELFDWYSSTETEVESISVSIEQMYADFPGVYEDEMKELNDWWVEAKPYADLALNPSGNLSSYTSSANDYGSALDRFEAAAGY